MRRLKKKVFLGLFAGSVAVLAGVRACAPEVVLHDNERAALLTQPDTLSDIYEGDDDEELPVDSSESTENSTPSAPTDTVDNKPETPNPEPLTASKTHKYHRILGVVDYDQSFPDVQDVQIVAARKWGVRPVRDRAQAEKRKSELVYIGSNPYYCIDKRMPSSIPYLVPRASELLQMIGRNYLDSLAAKGVPLHKIIVTSGLRTEEDVIKLSQRNGNVSSQSCHRFGTTFDLAQNRFITVEPPGEHRRAVTNDTLKWVLSEVLEDIREQGRCYIKYEKKQGCFHITTR